MTFSQIEKTKDFILQTENANCIDDIKLLSKELRAFWGEKFNVKLCANSLYGKQEYNEQKLKSDKTSICGFLEGLLSENDINNVVLGILDLIDEGNESIGDDKQMTDFVSKVYFSYNDKIKFDETTEIVATAPSELFNIGTVQADKNMVSGTINKLKNYGISLISQPSATKAKSNPQLVINNTNTTTASVNVNISVSIEQAKQQVEDAGFGDDQYNAVMDKLAEIESISNSQESKGGKWKKAKEVLKWCAEQGIEIAKIVLPLLPHILK